MLRQAVCRVRAGAHAPGETNCHWHVWNLLPENQLRSASSATSNPQVWRGNVHSCAQRPSDDGVDGVIDMLPQCWWQHDICLALAWFAKHSCLLSKLSLGECFNVVKTSLCSVPLEGAQSFVQTGQGNKVNIHSCSLTVHVYLYKSNFISISYRNPTSWVQYLEWLHC